jgi:hypothetical protein
MSITVPDLLDWRRRPPTPLDRRLAKPVQVRRPWPTPVPEQHPCGPYDLQPDVASCLEAAEALAAALDGIQLGRADKALLARTEQWRWSDVVVLAGLLARARQAGAKGGTR